MITRILSLALMAVTAFSAFALEVADLRLPLKRSEADTTLTKDYSFNVLTDGTVRRTWHLNKRTVAVDFDPAEDAAICITITYSHPVSRKVAEADADAIAPNTEVKWKKTKPEAVQKVGIPAGSVIREFDDKSMMFLEAASAKNKYTAVSYFSRAPHKDRKELQAVSGESRTAMGSASMAGDIKALIRDEEARQQIPCTVASQKPAKPTLDIEDDDTPAAATATTGKATTKPAATKTPAPKPATKPVATKTPAPKPAAPSQPKVTITGPNGTETVEGTVTVRTVTVEQEGEENDNLLDVIKNKATPVQICIAAAVALLLLFLIIGSASRSRAKKRQKARFAQVLVSTPAQGNAAPAPKVVKKH